eukprot:1142235-Rhodomonas_salina.1
MASMVFTGITIMHIDYVKRQSDAKKTMTVIAKPSRAIGALYCEDPKQPPLPLCRDVLSSLSASLFLLCSHCEEKKPSEKDTVKRTEHRGRVRSSHTQNS